MTWYKFFGGVARWVFDTEQEIHGNSVQEAAPAQTSSRKLTRLEQVTFSAKSLGIIRKNLNSNWGMCKCVNTKLLRVMVENL